MTPYCHTCHRGYHSRGIARHRRAHLDRGQECVITLADGTWLYRPDTADDEDDPAGPATTTPAEPKEPPPARRAGRDEPAPGHRTIGRREPRP